MSALVPYFPNRSPHPKTMEKTPRGLVMIIKFDEATPIYVQIMKGVMWDLAVGELTTGEKLPSVRDLASSAKVNPNTVQRAYMELERMGVVETQRGQGTFIVADPDIVKEVRQQVTEGAVRSFVDEMRRLRYEYDDIIALVAQELSAASTVRPADAPCAAHAQGAQRAPGAPHRDATDTTDGGSSI